VSTNLPIDPRDRLDAIEPAATTELAPAAQTNPLLVVHSLLRGRYILAICLAVIGGAIGAPVGYHLLQPQYRSVGMIRIQPILPKTLYETEQNSLMPMFESYVAEQVAQLNSRRLISEAMLHPEWKALGRGLTPDAVAAFEGGLEVTTSKPTLVQVSFLDEDPRAAATAVKAVIDTYRRFYETSEAEGEAEQLGKLRTLREDCNQELERINDEISRIAGELGPAALDPMYQQDLMELIRLKFQRRRNAESQALLAGTAPASQPSDTATTQPTDAAIEVLVQRDPRLEELRREQRGLGRELQRLLVRYGPNHRLVMDSQAALDVIEQEMSQRIEELRKTPVLTGASGVDAAALTPEQVKLQEEGLQKAYADVELETAELHKKIRTIEKLRSEQTKIRENLDSVTTRIERLSVERNVSGRISVISSGDIPFAPDKDRRKALTVLGGLGAAGAGVGFVMLLGLLDRRLHHVDAARSRLRQIDRVLGVLPELPNDLTDPDEAASAAFCVHHIRAMLQIRQRASGRKRLAITSPSPADGKTSLTITLGMSFASSGCKTLLVDCDFDGAGLTSRLRGAEHDSLSAAVTDTKRRPGARGSQSPPSATTAGLLSALRGESLEHAIVPTGYPMLSLLPLEVQPGAFSGHLSPDALRRLLDRLAKDYDTILIDSGPVVGSIEAPIVAAEADSVALVISRGGNRTTAEQAANLLIAAGAEIEGIVFNRAQAMDVAMSSTHSSGGGRSVRRSTGKPRRAEASVSAGDTPRES
jgi:Mrp family chromosome partitioning ATPase/uncharacterized protein involved in exopolysaccharide biosynthesis